MLLSYISLLQRGLLSMTTEADAQLTIRGAPMVIDVAGQVSGFKDVVGTLHTSVRSMFLAECKVQLEEGLVSSSFDRDTLALADVASFLMSFARHPTLQDL